MAINLNALIPVKESICSKANKQNCIIKPKGEVATYTRVDTDESSSRNFYYKFKKKNKEELNQTLERENLISKLDII